MYNHSFLGSNDVARARGFYEPVMAALGYTMVMDTPRGFAFPSPGGALIVGAPADGAPASVSNGATLGFKARTHAEVDAWHAAGLAHGGADEGAPGIRPNSPGQQYGAYLRDPDGNKICAFAPGAG